jgi:hypothetical protein
MREELITIKTAILLKNKGFDIPCLSYYDGSDMVATQANNPFDLKNYNSRKGSTLRSAPTQTLVQKWLREKHNIFIICTQNFYWDGVNHLVQVFKYNPEKERCYEGTMLYGDNGEFESYEVSLEFGLKLALELI